MSQEMTGKFFSIQQPQGVKTVIYRIDKLAKEYQTPTLKYKAERVVSSEEFNGTFTKKTFFIDFPEPAGENLVILSFSRDKVSVNMGQLKDDKIKFNKTQLPIQFNTLYSETPMDFKDFKYTQNLARSITIIDPETAEEIKPNLYLDETTNEVKGTCRLQPYKSYFTFEIR